MWTDRSETGSTPGRLEAYVDEFLESQRAIGYSSKTSAERRSIATGFARWAQTEGVAARPLGDEQVHAFVARRPPRDITKKERAVARRFLAHLRARGVLSLAEAQMSTPADSVAARYVGFLRKDRGLAENSILVYAPCAREFLDYRLAQAGTLRLDTLDADTIRTFLLGRIKDRSSESSRLVTVALRSLLRFLFLRGETPRDLSAAVPSMRTYRLAGVPVYLSPEEVDQVLATPDRSTTRGRRDYAILLLLARLGLRASEVVTLEVGDRHWRTAEIVVRGKGSRVDHLPLLADVGRAVATYLRHARGTTTSRRVFLRLIPR
jgi:site-specific recombinase XerD